MGCSPQRLVSRAGGGVHNSCPALLALLSNLRYRVAIYASPLCSIQMLMLVLAAQGAAFLPTTASSTVSTRPTSRPTVLRMGGFGGPVKSRTPKKKGKGKRRPEPNPSSKPAAAALAKDREPAAQSAVTAEQAQAAHMEAVRQAVERQAQSIASGLEQQGFAVVENFMSGAAVATMRAEATALLSAGLMAPSQSTRYDEARGEVVTYEKHNVPPEPRTT